MSTQFDTAVAAAQAAEATFNGDNATQVTLAQQTAAAQTALTNAQSAQTAQAQTVAADATTLVAALQALQSEIASEITSLQANPPVIS